jgi:putative glycosyltransferase (TIGR04372 family)
MTGDFPIHAKNDGEPGKGFAVVAFLGTQVLGDFIEYSLQAATVARSVRGGKLAVIYRDDRPYKNLVTLLNPAVTAAVRIPEDANRIVPMDWFDGRDDVAGRPFDDEWYQNGFHRPDLFLTPSMMGLHLCRRLAEPPAFRIPQAMEANLGSMLTHAGVDPERWLATVHMRQADYEFRRDVSGVRNVDPQTYWQMIASIVGDLGGQVVRLGDPSMSALPDLPGFVDLSRLADSFPLQAYALSRSRFFVGTASGPLALACAFKVPSVITNAIHLSMWNDGNAVLSKRNITFGKGKFYSGRQFIEALDVHPGVPSGMICDDNTAEELTRCAGHMFEATADCTGWRRPPAEGKDEAPADARSVEIPFPRRRINEGYEITWL